MSQVNLFATVIINRDVQTSLEEIFSKTYEGSSCDEVVDENAIYCPTSTEVQC